MLAAVFNRMCCESSVARLVRDFPVTLGLTLLMLLLNWGLVETAPELVRRLPALLEYDQSAIHAGEIWRLVTGNLVHWSVEHACLDIGAFVLVGWMFERRLRGIYAPLLMVSGLCVGLALFVGEPELEYYRGFSGINSAQFAAVVGAELMAAWRTPKRWLWVAPAAGIFVLKIASECATGTMFFGTESLGDIGLPVPMAHAAGALSGALLAISLERVSILDLSAILRRRPFESRKGLRAKSRRRQEIAKR